MAKKSKSKQSKPTTVRSLPLEGPCPNCAAEYDHCSSMCPACGEFVGWPNVRLAGCVAERDALSAREKAARAAAAAAGTTAEYSKFVDAVKTESRIVVTVSAEFAISFLSDSRQIYVNVERLVGASQRKAPTFANTVHRKFVEDLLFGGFAGQIWYGALSLSNAGVDSYGDLTLSLKRVAVENRVSFLESNSYGFIATKVRLDRIPAGGAIPVGYRAVWDNRHELAAAKHQGQITTTARPEDVILRSSTKADDVFIEAHVHGGFTVDSLDSVAPTRNLDESKRALAKSAIELFAKYKKKQ